MDIKTIRSEFIIYIVEPDVIVRKALETFLLHTRFNVKVFANGEELLKVILEETPHIIVTHVELPQITGLEILSRVKQISDDILMILITSDHHQALSCGAYDTISKGHEKKCLIPVLDRAIEKLYLQFQNEQLLEALEEEQPQTSPQDSYIKNNLKKIETFVQNISTANNTFETIECFMNHLSELVGQPVIYMKYLPSYTSLLLKHAIGLDIQSFKNTGIQMEGSIKEYLENIKNPQKFEKLKEFMLDIFQIKSYLSFPVITNQNILGLIVIFDSFDDKPLQKNIFNTYLQVFKNFLEKNYVYEKTQSLLFSDITTGAFNKKYCMKILDQEISRSSRIKHPVSLLYIGIDDFDVYVKQNGQQMASILLKMLTDIFIKTSRKVDFVVRFQAGEFVMILPHTDQEKAIIKAEKLRRHIATIKFPYMEQQPLKLISISVGISEYPSTAQDAMGLIQVADNALYQVKTSTKNRVCVGKAPEGFRPEFEILKVKSNPT